MGQPKDPSKVEEWKRKIAEGLKNKPKEWTKDPAKREEWLKNLSESHKDFHPTEETRVKLSESHKGERGSMYGRRGKDHPAFGRCGEKNWMFGRTGEKNPMFGKHHTEESRRKMVEGRTGEKNPNFGKPRSEETKKKIGKANSVYIGEMASNWKGGISFEPYCVKFNEEFRRRVRAFFGNECVECHKTVEENGQNMIVHHVNYDKMMCCNDVKPLFVTVCRSHNAVANFNREYWQEHFTLIINEKYGGKCYCSKEEMKTIGLIPSV